MVGSAVNALTVTSQRQVTSCNYGVGRRCDAHWARSGNATASARITANARPKRDCFGNLCEEPHLKQGFISGGALRESRPGSSHLSVATLSRSVPRGTKTSRAGNIGNTLQYLTKQS